MPARRQINVRRVYDEPDPADGRRVLVDRLWPRGLSKAAARVDEWVKADHSQAAVLATELRER